MLDKIAGALSNSIVGVVAVAAAMTNGADPNSLTAQNIQTFNTAAFTCRWPLLCARSSPSSSRFLSLEKEHAKIVKELEVKLASA